MTPSSRTARRQNSARRQQLVRVLVGLNLVAFATANVSAHWDAVEHLKGAVDTFWYPPHFGIYFSLLVAALVSSAGFVLVLDSPGTFGQKVRSNTALVTLTIANVLSVIGAPFDAWWHQTFGIDLTVWSPPHIHILIGMVLAVLGCALYFLDDLPVETPIRRLTDFSDRTMVLNFALAISLLQSAYLFFEYEGGIRLEVVLARPAWTYPVLWTTYVAFMLALLAALSRRTGMVSAAAAVYMLLRLVLYGLDRTLFASRGFLFYPLLLPALVFDLGLAFAWPRWGTRRPWWTIAGISLVVAAVVAVSTPLFWQWMRVSPDLDVQPWLTYWPLALLAGVPAGLAGGWCGLALRRLRPQPLPMARPAARLKADDYERKLDRAIG